MVLVLVNDNKHIENRHKTNISSLVLSLETVRANPTLFMLFGSGWLLCVPLLHSLLQFMTDLFQSPPIHWILFLSLLTISDNLGHGALKHPFRETSDTLNNMIDIEVIQYHGCSTAVQLYNLYIFIISYFVMQVDTHYLDA